MTGQYYVRILSSAIKLRNYSTKENLRVLFIYKHVPFIYEIVVE